MITNPIPAPNVRLLTGGGFAVISDWDETVHLSKIKFVTKTGTHFESRRCTLATSLKAETLKAEMLKAETLVRSQAVVARVVAGETLIVPIRAKVGDLASIYSFNGTGSLIWRLLESPRTVAELATAVAQTYEVDPARAEQDVANFVSEMKSVGLVEVPATSFVAMAGD
jgi:Coenzyme PQQ synthesis protein D (PqqD)